MTRLPKPIEPVDDLSDRSKVPRKQSRLLVFYENLKSAYKLHQKEGAESSTIRLKTCTFDVCWTKSDPAENEPLWGEISIENEKVDLMTVKDRKHGHLLRVVHLGIMNDFPISDAEVYYCPDNDMIYYYPNEAYLIDRPAPHFLVHTFRSFGSMVTEFV